MDYQKLSIRSITTASEFVIANEQFLPKCDPFDFSIMVSALFRFSAREVTGLSGLRLYSTCRRHVHHFTRRMLPHYPELSAIEFRVDFQNLLLSELLRFHGATADLHTLQLGWYETSVIAAEYIAFGWIPGDYNPATFLNLN